MKRRAFFAALAGLAATQITRHAFAFGEEGAFHPRPLLTGAAKLEGVRATAPARWARELRNRTSAPARLDPAPIRADDPALVSEPFAYWMGDADLPALTVAELSGLTRFFAEGGVLLIDDCAPETGAFGRAARRELSRVMPDASPIPIGPEHVVFHSFYFLRRPVGRIEGPPKLDAIVRGGNAQVIFTGHDLAGALAQTTTGIWSVPVEPGGDSQRELAIRLAVNIAMYVLCSDYKDDQVHAPSLMRRRAMEGP